MTTATHAIPTAHAATAFQRFAWKEYRMLRGLWLAVLVVGALVQWALSALMSPSIDHASMLFSTALAAAVLYAVGAAATTFSLEHEEETYGFLLALPTTWGPLFAGKLLVAALSALLLATALTATGWITSGYAPPGGRDSSVALGMFGMAIFEGLAWGTLFSLLVKRPLAAALWTLFVGTVAVNVAVNANSNYAVGSIVPRAYLEAVPLRLAFVGIVLAASVAVARRWLVVGAGLPGLAAVSKPSPVGRGQGEGALVAGTSPSPRPSPSGRGRVVPVPFRPSRGRSLARLLWQSCRESWLLLLLPIGVASLLVLAIVVLVGFSGPGKQLATVVVTATLVSLPALYGGLAFSADQRRGSHRFLAEHAARPRYVWLARHIVWLGALVFLFVAVVLIVAALTTLVIRDSSQEFLKELVFWVGGYETLPGLAYNVATQSGFAARGIVLAWFGTIAAYSIGQVCSMLMRSEILAAFLAVVLSVVLVAWVAALFAWQLSGAVFLLPLAAGLMLATWLRAPDWIAGRNAWPAWLKPALAGAAPLVLIGFVLPLARLSQVPETPRSVMHKGQQHWVTEHIDNYVFSHRQANTPEARETARLYMQAAERLDAGPKENYLARWESPGRTWTHGGVLEMSIPAEELDAFHEAEKKQLELIRASIVEAVDAAVEISRRQTGCRFEFELGWVVIQLPTREQENWSLEAYAPYKKIVRLQSAVLQKGWRLHLNQVGMPRPKTADEFTADFLERALAALRISAHVRSGQPSVVFMTQLQVENEVLHWIGTWASQDGRTSEELQGALAKLTAQLSSDQADLADALVADHLLVRDVLQGNEMPLALQSNSFQASLAYQAHQLPWERERAIGALNRITLYNIGEADRLTRFLSPSSESDLGNYHLRAWLRPLHYWEGVAARWQIAEPAAATSYLTALEYTVRVPIHELYRAYCTNLAHRRGALLQLALAAHRLDHGDYPPQLADLVPDYLDNLPLDPYASQPFQYEPDGLEWPLHGRVAPHTPFLWSVGAGNARLVRRYHSRYEDDDNDPGTEKNEIKERVYALASQERPWWNEPALVFPLAK